MEEPKKPAKKSRLTLYIIIALFLGIGLGFVLNQTYLKQENESLPILDAKIAALKHKISNSKDSLEINTVNSEIETISKSRTEVLTAREKKVEPFSLLADIFLRLIKMIVAPLVFSTLVVGVAKLGDISSVGRIGGKTLLWFIGASFTSLLLGLILVTLFKPGVAMHLPLPTTAEDTGLAHTGFTLKNFLYHMFPSSVVLRSRNGSHRRKRANRDEGNGCDLSCNPEINGLCDERGTIGRVWRDDGDHCQAGSWNFKNVFNFYQ